jgi:adenylate cyclase
VIAELQQKLGRPAEALATVTEALSVAHQSGQHYWESELYRLTGVLTLQAAARPGREAASAAESHFLRAIEIARGQRAKWLELRATSDLTRLWATQGKASEARALLASVYAWFTEGPEIVDLREAKSLLDELGA